MTILNLERRVFSLDQAEIRVERRADGSPTILGHPIVYNALSVDMGFRERVAPGAVTATIAEDDIRALFNHDPNIILGRNRAGTLRLSEDDRGLFAEIDPPDTQAARDLIVSIDRGDVSGWSFSFVTLEDNWQRQEDGSELRTLLRIRLYDVSPVVYPAYPQTDVALRSLEVWRETLQPAAPDTRDIQLDILAPYLRS